VSVGPSSGDKFRGHHTQFSTSSGDTILNSRARQLRPVVCNHGLIASCRSSTCKSKGTGVVSSGAGGVVSKVVWNAEGSGAGGNSRFAGSAPSYTRFGRILTTPHQTTPVGPVIEMGSPALLMIQGHQLARGSSFSRDFSVSLAGKGLSSSKVRENLEMESISITKTAARRVAAQGTT